MSSLTIDSISKRYGALTVVDALGLRVSQGEFIALLGPSGCGKTTILRMIAGLIEPDTGHILLGDRDITYTPVHRRHIGLVFQSYALFPHLTVYENLAFGLRRRNYSDSEIDRRVQEVLALVRLQGMAERYPSQLSGGQQQRVALARALAPEPSLLLLDEPLSNLDANLRDEMQVELKRIQRGLGVTTVFVTHDQSEALTLSDRICIIEAGRLQQVGTPEEIYYRPANPFVANFLGRSNAFTGTILGAVGDGGVTVRLDNGLEVNATTALAAGTAVEIVLRQESIALVANTEATDTNAFTGRVTFRAFAGATTQYIVELDHGAELLVDVPMTSLRHVAAAGERVTVRWPAEAVIVIPSGR